MISLNSLNTMNRDKVYNYDVYMNALYPAIDIQYVFSDEIVKILILLLPNNKVAGW